MGREANPSGTIVVVAPSFVLAMVVVLQLQGGGKEVTAGSVYTQHMGDSWAQCWMSCDGTYSADMVSSLMRTKLMAGLFDNPKMSMVATPPLMAAAGLCHFQ